MTMAAATNGSRYRVVQWATGNIGTKGLRGVIEHPELELVGVWVSSAAKVGRDAGDLCGLGVKTGVRATSDVEEILALRADCVLYMPQGCDFDVLCRLLESGTNVVTTRGEFHHPGSMDPAVRERIEAACRRGGTSIHSTGSSPGFISEALPIVLTSLQRRLDRLRIEEYAELSSRNSPDMLFRVMGFGKDPAAFGDARRWAGLGESFGPSLRAVTDALGLSLDSVEATGEVATATRDIKIAAGTVPAGTVAAQRAIVTGIRNGEPLISMSLNWYVSRSIDPKWELADTGWRVIVDGDCPFEVALRFTTPMERLAQTTPGYTANRAVNAVVAVCDAEPGIRTTADLPQVIATLG
jgi:4-hydroxy-tetrahydrodipicolinate reductase